MQAWDAVQGFYTIYRDVFDGLFKHETEAAERTGKKGPSSVGFGRSDSPWSEVSAFYQYWLQFVSDREFAWADVHNLASAPNRKVVCPLFCQICNSCGAAMLTNVTSSIQIQPNNPSCLTLQYPRNLRYQAAGAFPEGQYLCNEGAAANGRG